MVPDNLPNISARVESNIGGRMGGEGGGGNVSTMTKTNREGSHGIRKRSRIITRGRRGGSTRRMR